MLKIAIVGMGNIANLHIQAFLQFPERGKIVAVVDVYPDKARDKLQRYGLKDVRVYSDHLAMLADGADIDVVDVCTPPYVHAENTIAALQAGKHVLCEKPMAASLEECDAMIAAQKASGKVLSVVAQNRFTDAFWRLKAAVDSGLAGKICHAQVDSLWWRGHAYYDLWWRGTWEKEGGGCTLNHAVHHIDALQWMLGAPTDVVAMMSNVAHDNAEVEDLSAAIFRYPNGTLAQLTASVVHHGEDQKIILQGEKARLSAPWQPVAYQAAENGFPEQDHHIALENELDQLYAQIPPLTWTLHAGQVDDFFSAIEQQRAPLVDGEQGKQSLALITAIYKSAITHTTVTLPIASNDTFYRTGGLIASAPHFYEKQASVENFADEDAIPLGKNFA
ncbi:MULTISPECIES: Gfo/Idh/MocA family protein [Pantoea]|uniref:Oxidoreductase n=1 Tax=Pantoea stewartii TaxID=66269 RepID=A0AB34VBV5_9GAMM|nr:MULTISPECIES: Gfo/Idh/MocA family oxidoreductase [Pantoea]KKW49996.1 oxidoreductase [Pantoea ananatis]KTS71286.1 oxidoreductase [Pantoea stewartii]KTS94231.1 oxidoreductase [Pantoea stewartii]KTT05458.1 oxidoreductase [Pantoea stewartii]MBC0853582.1 Gfo/Idh/MocA family oxidoreductase [Pantoea stewartii]